MTEATENVETPPVPETPEVQEPAEQAAASAEEVTTSEESPPSEEPKPKKSGVQKRIDELVREREEAKREAQALKQRLEAANSGGDAPKLEDFDDYEEYVTAKAVYRMEQKQRQDEVTRTEQTQQAIAQENAQLFAARAEEAKTVYADYESVVNNPNLPITPSMAQVITAQENGPDIAYYLGKNPQIAADIARADPTTQAVKLGQVISQVSMQKPKPTSAPDPVTPVGGGSDVPEADPDKMTTEQWMEWRRKQLQ